MLDVRRLEEELGLALDASDLASLERARSKSPAADDATLLESVLVHETWFFRDPAVFDGVVECSRSRGAPVRVLSAPCSTGEEAYSLAIALRRAGRDQGTFSVLGVDVSEPALSRARNARYGAGAFRAGGAGPADCGLERDGDGWVVPVALREPVRFRRANLVADGVLSDEAPFDVVLCRNLLVYLSPAGQARLFRALSRLVAPGGWLFLGHADALPPEGFVRAAPERFSWRRADAPDARDETSHRVPRVPPPEVARSEAAPPPAPPTIETARALADEGRLEQAVAVCEGLLARTGHDAESYALLGTLHQARGKADDAMRAWQRAVYLDPEHPEALLQLGLALRARGEGARAEALLARAARGRRGQ